ncbi:MAG: NAD(P)(+) transhydrogenase (Re/Si-specific) subunit beta, partial [Pseudomonadales bacterium]|nr:NAD(P)(+) transhydrogenase (Re/Si-specific) subunit beta [Pseudomonadales bacterium]
MNNIELIANFSYIVAAILFVFGLKMLGSPATARRGNLLSSVGMLIAVIAGLTHHEIVGYQYIAGGVIVGALIGTVAARMVHMTAMPEMVALFNGFGGAASLLVGWAAIYDGDVTTFIAITVLLSMLIGGVTFSGSLVAYGKLSEVIDGRPYVFAGKRIFNSLLLVALIGSGIMLCMDPSPDS